MNEYTLQKMNADDAFEKAEFIITAIITASGMAEPEGGGRTYFNNTLIKILTIEKGTIEKGNALVSYEVLSFKNKETVEVPKVGNTYRFYISGKESSQALKAFKVTDI